MDAGVEATQERLPDALSKSPAAAHGLAGRSPASAEEGGLLFGNFLLATQEKVTRAPKAHESSCFDQASRDRLRHFALPLSTSSRTRRYSPALPNGPS
jgi:hypothetical protein